MRSRSGGMAYLGSTGYNDTRARGLLQSDDSINRFRTYTIQRRASTVCFIGAVTTGGNGNACCTDARLCLGLRELQTGSSDRT